MRSPYARQGDLDRHQPAGLDDPDPNGLGRRLELPRQVLRRTPNPIHCHTAAEIRMSTSTGREDFRGRSGRQR